VSTTHFGYYLELAWRSYRRNPWLTLSVVLTLAIGIGTSMTALALLHILSADPIPGKSGFLFQPRRVYADATHSPHTMIDFQEARALLDSAPQSSGGTILAEGFGGASTTESQMSPQSVSALHTTRSFFTLFNVPFLLGASWSENAQNAGEHVSVVSKSLAIKLFGRASVVGESLRYGGTLFRIVGVLDDWRQTPRVYNLVGGGEFMKADDIFTPIKAVRDLDSSAFVPFDCDVAPGAVADDRGQSVSGHNDKLFESTCGWTSMWVELPAAADVAHFRSLLGQRGGSTYRYDLENVPTILRNAQVVPTDVRVYSLLGVGFLLLCVLSASGALLGQFFRHGFETGLRRALGASSRDIRRQFLVESLLIGAAGGLIGLGLAYVGLASVRQLGTAFTEIIRLDRTMLLATLLTSIASGLLAGLLPAWRASRVDPGLQIRTN
jgi:putative ABC transport system permease protein